MKEREKGWDCWETKRELSEGRQQQLGKSPEKWARII